MFVVGKMTEENTIMFSHISVSQHQLAFRIGVAFGAVMVGVICGLVPLITGIVRRRPALAFGGLCACVVSGFLLGLLLAVPVSALFTVLIYLLPRAGSRDTERLSALASGAAH